MDTARSMLSGYLRDVLVMWAEAISIRKTSLWTVRRYPASASDRAVQRQTLRQPIGLHFIPLLLRVVHHGDHIVHCIHV